ncbi:MAG: hypothetical protein LC732_03225 [Acidobacteria bacterium]|nr:hypothetical protein [Acidobacteriota bacterium]
MILAKINHRNASAGKRFIPGAAVVTALAMLSTALASPPTTQIPDLVYQGGESPSWVSLKATYPVPDGALNLDLLAPMDRIKVQNYMKRARAEAARESGKKSPCPLTAMQPIVEWPDGKGSATTLVELQDRSAAIFVGTVVDAEVGFFRGSPATLLRVRPDEIVRNSSSIDASGDLLVYYPAARFTAGGTKFCSAARAHDVIPAPGDHVAVHVLHDYPGLTKHLVVGDSEDFVFERDGALIASPSILADLARSGITSLREFTAFLNARSAPEGK